MASTEQKTDFRRKLYNIIDTEQENPSIAAFVFETMITILIILSIVAIVAESFIDYQYKGDLAEWTKRAIRNQKIEVYFSYFEKFTLIVFTLEYLLRILTADKKFENEKSYFHAAWRFMTSSGGLIDFVAISPFLFQLAKVDFRFLRALKISRLLRILKLSSLTRSIVIVGDVFIEKRNELGITLFVTFVMLLVSATLMWYVEGHVQPDAFPNIIATFWWAIATLTTVGYGDVYPITGWGKLLSGIIAVLGIGIVALPAGILSSAFIERIERDKEADLLAKQQAAEEKRQNQKESLSDPQECEALLGQQFNYCPYCGEELDEEGKHIR